MAGKERQDKCMPQKTMEEYGVKTMEDVRNPARALTAETIRAALDTEPGNDLGRLKHGCKARTRTTEETAILKNSTKQLR